MGCPKVRVVSLDTCSSLSSLRALGNLSNLQKVRLNQVNAVPDEESMNRDISQWSKSLRVIDFMMVKNFTDNSLALLAKNFPNMERIRIGMFSTFFHCARVFFTHNKQDIC